MQGNVVYSHLDKNNTWYQFISAKAAFTEILVNNYLSTILYFVLCVPTTILSWNSLKLYDGQFLSNMSIHHDASDLINQMYTLHFWLRGKIIKYNLSKVNIWFLSLSARIYISGHFEKKKHSLRNKTCVICSIYNAGTLFNWWINYKTEVIFEVSSCVYFYNSLLEISRKLIEVLVLLNQNSLLNVICKTFSVSRNLFCKFQNCTSKIHYQK